MSGSNQRHGVATLPTCTSPLHSATISSAMQGPYFLGKDISMVDMVCSK